MRSRLTIWVSTHSQAAGTLLDLAPHRFSRQTLRVVPHDLSDVPMPDRELITRSLVQHVALQVFLHRHLQFWPRAMILSPHEACQSRACIDGNQL